MLKNISLQISARLQGSSPINAIGSLFHWIFPDCEVLLLPVFSTLVKPAKLFIQLIAIRSWAIIFEELQTVLLVSVKLNHIEHHQTS